MKLEKLNVVELNKKEINSIDGGLWFLVPIATVILAAAAVATPAALGYYNGYHDNKK